MQNITLTLFTFILIALAINLIVVLGIILAVKLSSAQLHQLLYPLVQGTSRALRNE